MYYYISAPTFLDEGEVVDDERESGDGQEEQGSESGSKKKVDHDEDRSNPQYIPKKGTFYEHDDRTVEDEDAVEQQENSENPANSNEALSNSSKILSTQNQKVTPKQVKKTKDTDRWSHDRFCENEQAPKSRSELVSAYGYDIRNEDNAPRPRRQRRYGRHQSKYDRNWEDEDAYKKSQAAKVPSRRPLRPEDFPALGATKPRPRRSSRPQDENDPQSSSNHRSPVRNRDENYRPRDDRGPRDSRNQRYNNDTSNNNNNRHIKGKKNINFNHNIEFKNQNRNKNINYESTQPKNNNVINQQMQTSTSSQSHGPSTQSGNQHQTATPRYNNEAPVTTMSFTNSKMNNTTNNSNAQPPSGSSRTILNFDNSSGNYGRGSREKEVNSQHQHQMHPQQMPSQAPTLSPNKNLQYTDHQIDQMKLIEKSYQQQQGKATNLNLNQVAQHPPMNNMQEAQMMNNTEMTRSKRYSSLRQRSNINDAQPQGTTYHQQYHQQEIEQSHVPNVMPAQQAPTYIPQQAQQAPPANMMTPQTVPQTAAQTANVQQQPQSQKYQAAYYAANPANDYAAQQAALMNAMVEKYQYQQQPAPAQYLPPPQAQQIFMPTQTQPPQQQQILNYVSTIQPQAPTTAPAYPQYTNYQNYNIQAPTTVPAPPQPTQAPPQPQPPAPQPIYQTQSGLTYYPNAQIAPAHPQRIIQPQRRPNPIPILAPRDHKKTQGNTVSADDSDKNADNEKGGSSAENIDHILDNMFVQRQPYEPTILPSLKDSQSASIANDDKSEEQINEGMNVS